MGYRSKQFGATAFPGKASGFTLIELMISMTISLILVSSTITLFVHQEESSRYIKSFSRIQENGRFALDILARNVRMARYDDKNPAEVIRDDGSTAGSGIFGADTPGGAGLSAIADTITTEYEGGTGIRDCLGRLIAANTVAVNLFAVDTLQQLICTATHFDSAGNPTAPAAATQPVVEGVEDMQILYGEDLSATGIPNRFITATNVTDWDGVVSVRVSLLLNSVVNVTRNAESTCVACTVFNPAASRLTRGEFTTSVGIRNKNI